MKELKYPYEPNSLLASISGSGVLVEADIVLLYKPQYKIYLNDAHLTGVNGIYILDFSDSNNNYTALVNDVVYQFNGRNIEKKTFLELDRLSKMMNNGNDSVIFDHLNCIRNNNTRIELTKESPFLNIIGSGDIDELLMGKALYDSSISKIGIDTLFNKTFNKGNRIVISIDKIIINSVYKGFYLDVNYDKLKKASYKLSYKNVPVLSVEPFSISIDSTKYSIETIESKIFSKFKLHVDTIKESIGSLTIKEIYEYCKLDDSIEFLMIKKFGEYKDILEVFHEEISKYDSPM